jgi:hypothetical protein
MRDLLFNAIASITGSIITANLFIGNSITSAIANIFNSFNGLIRLFAEKTLLLIDEEKFNYAKLASGQSAELNELNLLIAANKVKEDALSNKMWTMGHTIAMNRIGNALQLSCNWEPVRIHAYLKSVIESIPGMVYMSGDDFEDKNVV